MIRTFFTSLAAGGLAIAGLLWWEGRLDLAGLEEAMPQAPARVRTVELDGLLATALDGARSAVSEAQERWAQPPPPEAVPAEPTPEPVGAPPTAARTEPEPALPGDAPPEPAPPVPLADSELWQEEQLEPSRAFVESAENPSGEGGSEQRVARSQPRDQQAWASLIRRMLGVYPTDEGEP